jgi:hypothetical protein
MRKTAANAPGQVIKISNFCKNLIIFTKSFAKQKEFGDFRENNHFYRNEIFAKTRRNFAISQKFKLFSRKQKSKVIFTKIKYLPKETKFRIFAKIEKFISVQP